MTTQQHDLQTLIASIAAERLALIQRHEASARVVANYDFNNTYQYIIAREETHLSWLQNALAEFGATLPAASPVLPDPQAPRKRYSWEIEEEAEQARPDAERDSLEPPSPHDVPVLWKREPDEQRGVVLRFPSRD